MSKADPDAVTLPARPEAMADVQRRAGPEALLGRIELLEKLGEGGMGAVYAGYDPTLNRRVAIKVLRRELASAAFVTRMVREAQALARLSHPNVVGVYDVGVSEDQCFVAMEYVEGQTLDVVLAARPGVERVLELFIAAGQGLAAAHAAGLVHRDFKPQNVMVGRDGRARVLDFGLVRDSGEVDTPPEQLPPSPETFGPLTEVGRVMGTPGYMSPEQAQGRSCGAPSDQFSFCVALWRGLYGERPMPRAHAGSRLRTRRESASSPASRWPQPRPPPGHRDVPRRVRQALLRGLRYDPKERFPSMEALLAALRPRPRRYPVSLVYGFAVVTVLLYVGIAVDLVQRRTPKGWWARNKEACNPVRVTALLEEARAPGGPLAGGGPEANLYAATCLALAGDFSEAGRLAGALPEPTRERAGRLFSVLGEPRGAGPDSRLPPTQVPMLELALEYARPGSEEHARAAYYLGLAALTAGQAEDSRRYLEHFLWRHATDDAWRRTAQGALDRLDEGGSPSR